MCGHDRSNEIFVASCLVMTTLHTVHDTSQHKCYMYAIRLACTEIAFSSIAELFPFVISLPVIMQDLHSD